MATIRQAFTSIANAIRSKAGTTLNYKPSEMPGAITDIPVINYTGTTTLISEGTLIAGTCLSNVGSSYCVWYYKNRFQGFFLSNFSFWGNYYNTYSNNLTAAQKTWFTATTSSSSAYVLYYNTYDISSSGTFNKWFGVTRDATSYITISPNNIVYSKYKFCCYFKDGIIYTSYFSASISSFIHKFTLSDFGIPKEKWYLRPIASNSSQSQHMFVSYRSSNTSSRITDTLINYYPSSFSVLYGFNGIGTGEMDIEYMKETDDDLYNVFSFGYIGGLDIYITKSSLSFKITSNRLGYSIIHPVVFSALVMTRFKSTNMTVRNPISMYFSQDNIYEYSYGTSNAYTYKSTDILFGWSLYGIT